MVYCIIGCGVASTRSPSAFSIHAGVSLTTLPSGCKISMLSPTANLPRWVQWATPFSQLSTVPMKSQSRT